MPVGDAVFFDGDDEAKPFEPFQVFGNGAVVVGAVGIGEGFPGAEFFEQVIHACDGDVGMVGLHLLAVGIEPFAQIADFLFLLWGGIWKGERIKANVLVVTRSIFKDSSRS